MAKAKKRGQSGTKGTNAGAGGARAKRSGAAGTAIAAAPAEREWTLDEIVTELGAPRESFSAMLLAASTPTDKLALGTQFATGDILASGPSFLGASLIAWRHLSAAQRERFSGLSESVMAVAAAELVVLRGLQRELLSRGGGSGAKRDRFRVVMSEGVSARDKVLETLLATVPADSKDARVSEIRARVEQGVGTAGSGEELAAALEKLATLVRDALSALGRDWGHDVEELGIDGTLAASLQASASIARSAESRVQQTGSGQSRVDQRELDLQDGAVLVILRRIYRAFAEAHGGDATIVVPSLGRLRRLAGGAARAAAKPAQPKPSATASPSSG